jgi:hypothetical protein
MSKKMPPKPTRPHTVKIPHLIQEMKRHAPCSTRFWRALNDIKQYADVNSLATAWEHIKSHPPFRELFYDTLTPASLDEVSVTPEPAAPMAAQLRWTYTILRDNVPRVSTFVQARQNYSKHLLRAEYADASADLDRIEKSLGHSIWLMEQRINLLALAHGLEQQKIYANSILSGERSNGIIRILAYHMSTRSENNYTAESYLADLHSAFTALPDGMRQFLLYKCAPILASPVDTLTTGITYDGRGTLVDRYVHFVQSAERMIGTTDSSTIKPLQAAIQALAPFHSDNDLLCVYPHGVKTDDLRRDDLSQKFHALLAAYTVGDYANAITLGLSLLQESPGLICAADIVAKARCYTNCPPALATRPSLSDAVNEDLYRLYEKGSGFEEAFAQLLKISITYASEPWASLIGNLVLRHKSSDFRSPELASARAFRRGCHPANPRCVSSLTDDHLAQTYLDTLDMAFHDSPVTALERSQRFPQIANSATWDLLPKHRAERYRARKLAEQGCPAEAIAALQSLLSEANTLAKQEAAYDLIVMLIQHRDHVRALMLVADSFISGDKLFLAAPISKLLSSVEAKGLHQCADKLALAIVLHLYSSRVNSDKDMLLAEVVEQFLQEEHVSLPSQIQVRRDPTYQHRQIYFLARVCSPEVLEWLPDLANTDDVENERVRICNVLRRIDPAHESEYADEIKQVTRKSVTRKAVTEIETSKIHVNVTGIFNDLRPAIRQAYERLKVLPQAPPGAADSQLVRVVVPDATEDLELAIPGNESLNVFSFLVLTIRDHFVLSHEHGLDGYLSVGIRHGTLAGMLRRPLEQHQLVTKRDRSDKYAENTHWLTERDGKTYQELAGALNDFSRNCDGIIASLKNRWIQICTEKRPTEGVFDYTIEVEKLLTLYRSSLSTMESPNQLFDNTIDFLWELTDRNLEVMRSRINNELKEAFRREFVNLQRKVASRSDFTKAPDLQHALSSSRTELQRELTRLGEWFSRPTTNSTKEFAIDTALRTALEMVRNIYPNTALDPHVSQCAAVVLRGRAFHVTVDICFIIIENIVRHCGSDTIDHGTYIGTQFSANGFLLIVRSPIASEQAIIKAHEYVKEFSETVNHEDLHSGVAGEGGSGLKKIRKLLAVDLGGSHELNVSLEGSTFSVQIDFFGRGPLYAVSVGRG